MENVQWFPLKYRDIKSDVYEVTMGGLIRNKNSKKLLYGNNPENEKGYVRVALSNSVGKYKKYPLHRLILSTFYMDVPEYEVNHKDGNKLNNAWDNLEYTDRLGNAVHAKYNKLYQSCEEHYKAVLTNKEVEKICELMSKGYTNSSIMKQLNLNIVKYMSTISKIRNRKTWNNISAKYTFPPIPIYKKYKEDDIYEMCKYIHVDNIKISKIIQMFPQYSDKGKLKNVLKKIKQKKLYKNIIFQVMCSTTIETNLIDE